MRVRRLSRRSGAEWGRGLLACAALLVAPAAASAAVQAEPFARVALEGGYDSNVLYDGGGGDSMGRVSPDVGVRVRDHLWSVMGSYGADLLTYPELAPGPTVNQRGRLDADWRLSRRTTFALDVRSVYAPDPAGLARLGIVGRLGSAFTLRGDARLAWRASRRLTYAATFMERVAHVSSDGGVALHAPGVEATWRLDPRTEVGAGYRFDWFQPLGSELESATAHEPRALARWRWSRRLTLEADAGPTLWNGDGGPTIVPAAGAQLLASSRFWDLRVGLRHGLGLNALARASVTDSVEVGAVRRFKRSFRVRADGGVWRGGTLPSGSDATLGYGIEGEGTWIVRPSLEVGIAGSRFARIDSADGAGDLNVVGLRVAWLLDSAR
jgi:hypothetical protein